MSHRHEVFAHFIEFFSYSRRAVPRLQRKPSADEGATCGRKRWIKIEQVSGAPASVEVVEEQIHLWRRQMLPAGIEWCLANRLRIIAVSVQASTTCVAVVASPCAAIACFYSTHFGRRCFGCSIWPITFKGVALEVASTLDRELRRVSSRQDTLATACCLLPSRSKV